MMSFKQFYLQHTKGNKEAPRIPRSLEKPEPKSKLLDRPRTLKDRKSQLIKQKA